MIHSINMKQQRKELTDTLKKSVREYQEIKTEIRALALEVKNPAMRMTASYSDMPRGGGGGSLNGIEKALLKRDRLAEELKQLEEKAQAVQTLAYEESIVLDFIESGESYRGFAKMAGMSRWKVCKLINEAIERHVSSLLGKE